MGPQGMVAVSSSTPGNVGLRSDLKGSLFPSPSPTCTFRLTSGCRSPTKISVLCPGPRLRGGAGTWVGRLRRGGRQGRTRHASSTRFTFQGTRVDPRVASCRGKRGRALPPRHGGHTPKRVGRSGRVEGTPTDDVGGEPQGGWGHKTERGVEVVAGPEISYRFGKDLSSRWGQNTR